ncbi:hypothetical protein JCM11491_007247 [Sporobolomyces phaffii]
MARSPTSTASGFYEGAVPSSLADSLLHPTRTRTRTRSRTDSAVRPAVVPPPPWYRRPSPVWLLPGTFLMAASMGMTYAPKLEIYTQLICRTMDPARSNVTVPGPEDDTAEWANQCHRSPAVQQSVATLALTLTLLMGVLSSLTTGWWGAYSDRHGRKPVLVLAMLGTVAMDAVFLATVNYHSVVSYNFLVLGPVLDGLVGGFSTAQAATNAYLADSTRPGSRARVLSLVAGLMFAGFALGPVLGTVLVAFAARHGSTDPTAAALVPFYVALVSHVGYVAVLAVALPESLAPDRQLASRVRHAAEVADRRDRDAKRYATARDRGVVPAVATTAATRVARLFGFLRPLALLWPHPRKPRLGQDVDDDGDDDDDDDRELRANIDWGRDLREYWHPQDAWKSESGSARRTTRDWTLTKIAFGYATYMMIIAIIQSKLQYANYTFDWSAREDGLFLSYIGVLRVVALVGFLPLVIRILRPAAPDPIRPEPRSSPNDDDDDDDKDDEVERWRREQKWLKVVSDSHFDLRLAQGSLVVDLVGFALFASASLARPHPTVLPFLVATWVQSLGSGASPTLQSLALAHASPRDAGRLFASLSVVQSLASQVLGPVVFATTFIHTVGRGYPYTGTIFAVAAVLCAVSLGCVSSLELTRVWIDPRDRDRDRAEPAADP